MVILFFFNMYVFAGSVVVQVCNNKRTLKTRRGVTLHHIIRILFILMIHIEIVSKLFVFLLYIFFLICSGLFFSFYSAGLYSIVPCYRVTVL